MKLANNEIKNHHKNISKPNMKLELWSQSEYVGNVQRYVNNGNQWYENNPSLFDAEKKAMSASFPNFSLELLDDRRLCWHGWIRPRILKNNIGYYVIAVYEKNHPIPINYGFSLRVYPVEPDAEELLQNYHRKTGCFIPSTYFLRDSIGEMYINPIHNFYVDGAECFIPARSLIFQMTRFFECYELILAHDLPVDFFSK